jgi:hypothetical protein
MARGGKREGAGRKPGVPNKDNAELREMILGALDKAGGVDYLTTQAVQSPAAFLTLIGKVLPTTLQGTGKDGAIAFEDVTDARTPINAFLAEFAAGRVNAALTGAVAPDDDETRH